MQSIFTKRFWAYSTERAIKTFSQTALAMLAVNQTTIINVDIWGLLASAGTAAIVSLLTSIVSTPK